MFLLYDVTCAGITMDSYIPTITSTIYNIVRIGVPLLLIFFGMLDLGKAVMAQKDEDIKKGQQTFVKRLVAAVIVFLVFFIVQIVVNIVAPKQDASNTTNGGNIMSCVKCFVSGPNATNGCSASSAGDVLQQEEK